MLAQPMMEKLAAMRLHGMVDALKTQEQDPPHASWAFLDQLGLVLDHQCGTGDRNQALAQRLHVAKLRGNACVEEIDYRAARGLDKSVIRSLAQGIGLGLNHEHIFIRGPIGVGKELHRLRPWSRRHAAMDTPDSTHGQRLLFPRSRAGSRRRQLAAAPRQTEPD